HRNARSSSRNSTGSRRAANSARRPIRAPLPRCWPATGFRILLYGSVVGEGRLRAGRWYCPAGLEAALSPRIREELENAPEAAGREIIYSDESPGLGRAKMPDRRPFGYVPAGLEEPAGPPAAGPGAAAAGGEESPSGLRWDALAGEWVIVAAQRQDRTFLPPP